MQAKLGITGLTGPGEVWFNNSVGLSGPAHADENRLNVRSSHSEAGGDGDLEDEEEALRARRMMPSVFSELREAEEGKDELDEADEEDEYGSETGSYRDRKNKFGWDSENYTDPQELDASASAAQIVQAWAFRLKGEYIVSACNV
jgi:hypothetical protein